MVIRQVPSSSAKVVELCVDNIINWKSYWSYESAVFPKVEVFLSESMFKTCSLGRNEIKSARNKNPNFFKISSGYSAFMHC